MNLFHRLYAKALELNPKNGHCYNQLAYVSLFNGRKLDAVYYYCRSLMTVNVFQSAKESLLGIFEDTKRKVRDVLTLKAPREKKSELRRYFIQYLCLFLTSGRRNARLRWRPSRRNRPRNAVSGTGNARVARFGFTQPRAPRRNVRTKTT